MSPTCPNEAGSHLYKIAVSAVQRLQSAGFTAYFAGGCVRDLILKLRPKDYDIATNALPSQVETLFPGSGTSGKSFAVTRAPLKGATLEIATFRRDHSYSDGRRPGKISFTDPETDAQRRDFTINAIFLDPTAGKFHDFTGGRKDLKKCIIRCVGDPYARFAEDHLRMLRAVRFAGTLGFTIHPLTAKAIRKNAHKIGRISVERIHDELTRILMESKRPGDSIGLLDKVGLLEHVLPEVTALKGQEQPPEFHPEGDVFTHTVAMLNMMADRTPQLAYSILFHDIGKPVTAFIAPDRIRFNNHAVEGALIAQKIMQRLRFSSDDISTICHCVKNHMRFMDVMKMRRATLRKMTGAPTFPIELELHRLDCMASHGDLSNLEFLQKFQEQIAGEPALPPPWVTGKDIIAMGIPESPQVGRYRAMAYDAQLEGIIKDRKALLKWIRNEIRKSR